jgi:hypothetical protein
MNAKRCLYDPLKYISIRKTSAYNCQNENWKVIYTVFKGPGGKDQSPNAMDVIEDHPDFIYSLILDDEETPLAHRTQRLRIAAALGSLYLLGTTLRNRLRNPSRRFLTRANLLPEPR